MLFDVVIQCKTVIILQPYDLVKVRSRLRLIDYTNLIYLFGGGAVSFNTDWEWSRDLDK